MTYIICFVFTWIAACKLLYAADNMCTNMVLGFRNPNSQSQKHRRKGKAVGGTEFMQFLAALAILHEDDFEEEDEFILFSKSS